MKKRLVSVLLLCPFLVTLACGDSTPPAQFDLAADAAVLVEVADLTELAALDVTGLPNYVTVIRVLSVGDDFQLVPHAGTVVESVLVDALDGRQWSRKRTPNPIFIAAKYWAVGASGNDEAQCWGVTQAAADAVKCATMGEINRRLVGWDGSTDGWYPGFSGPSIHLTSSISTAAFAVLTNLRPTNGNTFPRIYGDLIPVDSGAVNRTITAYQPAVPASNTERTVTITGLGTTPQYVARAIVKVDKTKFAWVTRQTVSDQLAISQVRYYSSGAGDALAGSSGVISDFVVSDVVSMFDMAVLPDWPFVPGVAFPLVVNVRLGTSDPNYFAHGNLGYSAPYIIQTIFGDPTHQTSYELAGGIVDTGGQGLVVQPLFVGSHNVLSDANWYMQSATFVHTTASPFFRDCSLQFGGELNVTSATAGAPVADKINFPEQSNGAIAMFDMGYPYGAFQLAPTSHHGGGAVQFYRLSALAAGAAVIEIRFNPTVDR